MGRTKSVAYRSIRESERSKNVRVEKTHCDLRYDIVLKKRGSAKSKHVSLLENDHFLAWWFSCLSAGTLGLRHFLGMRWPAGYISASSLLHSFERWMKQHRSTAYTEISNALDLKNFSNAVRLLVPGPAPATVNRVRIPALSLCREYFEDEILGEEFTWPKEK